MPIENGNCSAVSAATAGILAPLKQTTYVLTHLACKKQVRLAREPWLDTRQRVTLPTMPALRMRETGVLCAFSNTEHTEAVELEVCPKGCP